MLVAMILMAALLAGAAVLVSLQVSSNRNTELTKLGITALHCAEAGLTASRTAIGLNQTEWATNLGTGSEPAFLSSIVKDVDGDTTNDPDFEITLWDNWDEVGTDVPGTDADGKIFIVSRCLRYLPDTPREVRELIDYTTITNCYTAQRGGCGGNGNMN
jgi:type II secretory pathway pseudopilin PulG